MRRDIYSISEEECSNENDNSELDSASHFVFGCNDELNMSAYINDAKNKTSNCQRRMLRKCGTSNVRKIRLQDKRRNLSIHFQDLFTSLVECRWRWIFFTFTIVNVITWYIFGIIWWIVAYHHGDLKSNSLGDDFNDKEPCIYGVNDFGYAVMFSIEVQSTIGFGVRYPTTKCPEAMFLLTIQILFGTLLMCIITGLIFVKAARPMARSKAIVFSEKAVICMRDGNLCLLFRVADVRKSKILGANLKAYVLFDRSTIEGETLRRYQKKLEISVDEAGSDVILFWPLTICHKIDANSPLFEMDALNLLESGIEIIVSLSGVIETTGQSLEARTSYVPSEIFWGHRFAPVINKLPGHSNYIVDYKNFDRVISWDTPMCSGRKFSDFSDPNSPTNFFFGPSFDEQHLLEP